MTKLEILRDTPPWEWPRDAGKIFKGVLRNKRAVAAERLIAADLAGDLVVMNDDMADVLMAITADASEPDELRARSAISLGPVLEQTYIEGFDDDLAAPPISEPAFEKIQSVLRKVYLDESAGKELRRRVLEASVRAPQDWHRDAIPDAFASGDREWRLTAVFGMRWVRGFDNQILEALKSGDAEIRREAIEAAGNWEVDAAWPDALAILNDARTPKELLLATIEAAGTIRPQEAKDVLMRFVDSRDEDIAEAADEALMMAKALWAWAMTRTTSSTMSSMKMTRRTRSVSRRAQQMLLNARAPRCRVDGLLG